jgi:uncharacterized delta-60 repeat protein
MRFYTSLRCAAVCLLVECIFANACNAQSAGDLDTAFNARLGGSFPYVRSLVAQPDGKILLGGDFTSIQSTTRNRIARLNTDGGLDSTFDPRSGPNSTVESMAIQSDGKIVLGGQFTTVNGVSHNRVARLNADGSLDTTFNPSVTGASLCDVLSVLVQPDGKIVFGGKFTSVNGAARPSIARLNADGTLDSTFQPDSNGGDYVFAVALQTDGKIVAGGSLVRRLTATGSTDASFGAGFDNTVRCVAIQKDGKILVGGYFSGCVTRLNSNGGRDSTFKVGTGATSDSITPVVYSLCVQGDGKIILGGGFSSVNGVARSDLARLNADGTADGNFVPTQGLNSYVYSIGIQPNAKILVGGEFSLANGGGRSGLARFYGDSSLLKILSISYLQPNRVHLTCLGVPSGVHRIEVSPDLGAGGFVTTATITADAQGFFEYDDTAPGQRKFYRLAYP